MAHNFPLKLRNRIENYVHHTVATFYARQVARSMVDFDDAEQACHVVAQLCETNLFSYVDKIPERSIGEAQAFSFRTAKKFAQLLFIENGWMTPEDVDQLQF